MVMDTAELISDKMNGVEWRMKWKEYLKESVLNDNKNCMLNLNVDKGEMRGVCKRGEEVIEVKENENEVELKIESVLNELKKGDPISFPPSTTLILIQTSEITRGESDECGDEFMKIMFTGVSGEEECEVRVSDASNKTNGLILINSLSSS